MSEGSLLASRIPTSLGDLGLFFLRPSTDEAHPHDGKSPASLRAYWCTCGSRKDTFTAISKLVSDPRLAKLTHKMNLCPPDPTIQLLPE